MLIHVYAKSDDLDKSVPSHKCLLRHARIGTCHIYETVIPQLVNLYEEIIHELDYYFL